MTELSVTFLGATGTVTGSKFLLSHGETRVLIDAGLFQGIKELRLKNWEPFEIDPASISAIVLTHAHLDHCGYLPKLVSEGFTGKVYATEYTAKLADIILRDSARIQVEDAKYAAKKGYSKHNPPLPLYDESAAEAALAKIVECDFSQPTEVASGCYVTFHPAGHILGAAFLEIEFAGKRLVFSGDLGRPEHPILRAPERIPNGELDALICESTYGDREHVELDSNLSVIINQTVKRGGSVLIPAFAVDRTEVILVELRKLMESGQIPSIPVYVDSPMALAALSFFREAIRNNSPEIRQDVLDGKLVTDPFDSGELVELNSVEESKSINEPSNPCIIISASGMATGGRVVHHLAGMLSIPRHTIILVGYQSLGTRGRSLVDGAEFVRMHGEEIPVRAQIEQISAFSVHADASEIIDWISSSSAKPKKLFLVHGEEDSSQGLQKLIENRLGHRSIIPTQNQVVLI